MPGALSPPLVQEQAEETASGLLRRLPDSPNPYAFVLNDPPNILDPDGREPITIAITVYTIGKGLSHTILACANCSQCVRCKLAATALISKAAQEYGSRNRDLDFHMWLRNARPGSECNDLCADCGTEAVYATVWFTSRFIVRYAIRYAR